MVPVAMVIKSYMCPVWREGDCLRILWQRRGIYTIFEGEEVDTLLAVKSHCVRRHRLSNNMSFDTY